MVHASHDAPRVIIFPPIVPIVTLVIAVLLQWAHPLGVFDLVPRLASRLAGAALLAVGIGLLVSGRLALIRAGTNVQPTRPALALVESGVFRWTRNPIYLGGSFAMFGLASLVGLDWLPLLFLVDLAILHFGIILPEEVYLERKFGDRYRHYKAKVPRYLGI